MAAHTSRFDVRLSHLLEIRLQPRGFVAAHSALQQFLPEVFRAMALAIVNAFAGSRLQARLEIPVGSCALKLISQFTKWIVF